MNENVDRRSRTALAGPGIMLLSAAIFGFFGFFYGVNWNTPGVDGQPVFFRVLCGWTLKASAIGFLISALATFAKPVIGNLMYGIVGLIGAVLFVVVAILDLMDKQHTIMAYAPVILLAFAAWNGYGSYVGLAGILRSRASRDVSR